MIFEATARRVGKLADHLARTGHGSNKRVAVRSDLVRNCPVEIEETLRLCAAYSRTVPGVRRDFLHVKISPNHELSDAEIAVTLAAYEQEYGIPSDALRHVTQHWKGDRSSHLHVVYAMINPETGKALRLWRSFERDEALARSLEVRFGEPITPSARAERVAQLLEERGDEKAAAAVRSGPHAERGHNANKAERAQATRRGADQKAIDGRLLALWQRSGANLTVFIGMLEAADFDVARGDKAIMLIDLQTGLETPLAKHLNRVTKAAGQAARLKEGAVRELAGDARPLEEVRAETIAKSAWRAHEAVAHEFALFRRELATDDQDLSEDDARLKRAREKLRSPEAATTDTSQVRAQILANYRRRDRIRRARVARAFVMARIFGSRDMRRLAFLLAGAGALMTGAGLVAALATAGIAASALPNYEGAYKLRRRAREEQGFDQLAMRRELAMATDAARARQAKATDVIMEASSRIRPTIHSEQIRRNDQAARAKPDDSGRMPRGVAGMDAQLHMRSTVHPDQLRRDDQAARGRPDHIGSTPPPAGHPRGGSAAGHAQTRSPDRGGRARGPGR